MEKINVLWIEDNPIQESIQVRDMISRMPELSAVFDAKSIGLGIPAIHFNEKSLRRYHQYFNLQVLQHPIEIKDFITMCLKLEDEKGVIAFKKMGWVLPDIIVFDYQFGEKLSINRGAGSVGYTNKFKAVREFINPNFKFKKNYSELFAGYDFLLEDPSNEKYEDEDFLMTISRAASKTEIKKKDRDELGSDDFGLFSAIEILQIFRNHICVAIPATYNKRQTEQMSLHGKYFEWLNEYDYTINFDRAGRGSKSWDDILKDAAKALRLKIAQQVRQSKLTPFLIQLSQLASGVTDLKIEHRKMTFQNAYGIHQIPLDGLFLDVPEGDERNDSIVVWAEQLLETGITRQDQTAANLIIRKAIDHADTLWGAFQSDLFCERMNFSKLHKIKSSKINNKLSVELEAQYNAYFVSGKPFEIGQGKGRQGEDIYFIKNAIEIKNLIPKRRGEKLNSTEISILSWTALFVFLRLFKGRAEYLKKANMASTTLPSKKELLTLLFPIASRPIMLPIDNGDETNLNEFTANFFFNLDEVVNGDANLFAEDFKFILRAYAASIGLTDEKYMPDWIKAL